MSSDTNSSLGPSRGSGSSSTSSSAGSSGKKPLDPILRNALRYTVSPKEYELLHSYLLSRAPEAVKSSAPKPKRFEASVKSGNEYNISSVRASIRLFVAVYGGLKGWELISLKILKRRQPPVTAATPALPKGATARVAASFSLMLLFHRLLHRFFTRLRSSLLESNAAAFRERNPRIAYTLTSSLTPILGASLSGLFLGLSPSSPLRTTIAIYVLSRSLEFTYNLLEETRLIFPSGERPSWFGSWLLMPFCYGQLLHAFVFDRDCFPAGFGEFILGRSPEYIHPRPATWPAGKPYPSTYDVVDALASLSRLHWPPFSSQILTPSVAIKPAPSPALNRVRPLSGPAHPLTRHASCALLHPHDPSCARVNVKYWIQALGKNMRFIGIVYSAFALLSIRKAMASPGVFSARLAERVARLAIFITGAIGTSWGSICLFNALLPRGVLPKSRWFLGGALGGSWAYVARRGERGNFLYALRLSIDSAWKVGVKHRWWRPVAGGDVLVFTAALAALQVVHAARPGAIKSGPIAKGLGWTRGMEWSQGAVVAADKSKKIEGKEE